jgi:acetyl-CoA acetyltransferase
MSEVFILSCVQQTSMTLPCVQLAALSASDALRQAAITPERLEMLVWGGRDLLESSVVPLIHLQRRGAAGLQAVWSAAQAVAAGDCDLVMAGGAGWLDSPLDNLEAVNAAATMVLASTVAVGKYNLPPMGRLVSRAAARWEGAPETSLLLSLVHKALQRAELELTDVAAFRLGPCHSDLSQAWLNVLGVEIRLVNRTVKEDEHKYAGEADGCLLLSRLLGDLELCAGRFGLSLYFTPDHSVMVTVVEKI